MQASVVAVRGLSSCGLWALERRLSSCGAWAWLLRGMWDLPGPGIEPMSPALAGGFLTTVPPGKSNLSLLFGSCIDFYFFVTLNPSYFAFLLWIFLCLNISIYLCMLFAFTLFPLFIYILCFNLHLYSLITLNFLVSWFVSLVLPTFYMF